MSLNKYNEKRHFDKTPEPAGRESKGSKQLIFVVQRHEATALHYDFRLELDGVLKSWAVPKGPSLDPEDKRLAVEVEDHPLSYAGFSGDIPEGNYGAGHVAIWDKGTYLPVDEKGQEISQTAFAENLKAGHIRFVLDGTALKGRFSLVRTRLKGGGDKNNWLLFKARDEFSEADYDAENIPPAVHQVPDKKNKKATPNKEKKFKKHIHPMTARLHDGAFDDKDWIFEIKWDGYRAIAEVNHGDVRLYSRNGLNFESDYPAVFQALQQLPIDAVLDGEIVAFDKNGNPDFQKLQSAKKENIQLTYNVFDLLYMDGESVENLPLLERKKLLKEILPSSGIVLYSDHVSGQGKDFFRVVQERGLEGMMAKKGKSLYREGRRTEDWLKVKHVQTDEAIICGYTEPKGSRRFFGSLLLGMYQEGRLTYIGHTGTGFNAQTLESLYETMQAYKTDESPFSAKVKVNNPVTWLRPELVANIKYAEITNDGIRRHPVYVGLRTDKPASEVTGEDAASLKPKAAMNKDESRKAGNRKVPVTHTDKVYWPEERITKGEMIDYYQQIAKTILPYLKDRPLSLKRNPNGIQDQGFFHKDAGGDAPEWVTTKEIRSESSDRDVNYIICNNEATLVYLANLGTIELNPWHSTIKHLDNPDYMILDLDPSGQNSFNDVVDVALAVREILDKAGAVSYPKTSGSSGIHIYVPMGGKYTYDQVSLFSQIVANLTTKLLPDLATVERSLKKRSKSAIYVDYGQNHIGQTVAAPYSLRPRPHAPVSAPLHWKEVKPGLAIGDFNIKNMKARIEKEGDLFRPVLKKGVDLEKCLKRLENK